MFLMRSFFLFSRILGRAAFTGNHQWFLANNHIRDAHPPEVCGKKNLLILVSIMESLYSESGISNFCLT